MIETDGASGVSAICSQRRVPDFQVVATTKASWCKMIHDDNANASIFILLDLITIMMIVMHCCLLMVVLPFFKGVQSPCLRRASDQTVRPEKLKAFGKSCDIAIWHFEIESE